MVNTGTKFQEDAIPVHDKQTVSPDSAAIPQAIYAAERSSMQD